MPIMKDYEIEVELTVRIRKNNGEIGLLKTVERGPADSYTPDRTITQVAQSLINDAAQQIWKHTLVVEVGEENKTNR